MIDVVAELVAEVVGSSLDLGGSSRRQQQAWEKAYARGRDVVFLGYVESPATAGRGLGGDGWLVLSAGELFATPDPGFGRGLWHRIPAQEFVEAPPTEDDRRQWPGFECGEGNRRRLIRCEPGAEKYVRLGLGGSVAGS